MVACPNDDTIVSAPRPPAIVERGKLADTLIVEATRTSSSSTSPSSGSACVSRARVSPSHRKPLGAPLRRTSICSCRQQTRIPLSVSEAKRGGGDVEGSHADNVDVFGVSCERLEIARI
jgi:hypothetical protein